MTKQSKLRCPEGTQPELDWIRIIFLIFAVLMGLLASWLVQPWIHANEEARSMVVSVFSIFAGFLVTIMTILGEPSFYSGLNWRGIIIRRDVIFPKLYRHQMLFICYMAVLAMVFATSIIIDKCPEHWITIWLERGYIGFATFAFVLSLALPRQLMYMQMQRYEEALDQAQKRKSPLDV